MSLELTNIFSCYSLVVVYSRHRWSSTTKRPLPLHFACHATGYRVIRCNLEEIRKKLVQVRKQRLVFSSIPETPSLGKTRDYLSGEQDAQYTSWWFFKLLTWAAAHSLLSKSNPSLFTSWTIWGSGHEQFCCGQWLAERGHKPLHLKARYYESDHKGSQTS